MTIKTNALLDFPQYRVSLVYLGLAAKTEYQPVRVEWLDELEIRLN